MDAFIKSLPIICALSLALFFPAIAWCYQTLRLPKKRDEMKHICESLGLSNELEHCPYGLFKTYEETTGKDYFLPVAFCFMYSFIALSVLFDPGIFGQITGHPNSQVSLLIHSLGQPATQQPGIQELGLNRAAMIWNAQPVPVGDIANARPEPLPEYALGNLTMILMASLGCFVWTILYIGRRLNTLDLSPSAFFSVATRLVFSSFIALAVRHILLSFHDSLFTPALPAIAFFIGMFPERGLHYLKEKLGKTFSEERQTKDLPLGMIEGINLYTKTRLSEVNIDNAQNLAEANFIEILLRTPFNPWKILDWIAQAKLYVRIPGAIEELRERGIRTIFDFKALTSESLPKEQRLTKTKHLDEETITLIHQAIEQDPSVTLLEDIRRRIMSVPKTNPT